MDYCESYWRDKYDEYMESRRESEEMDRWITERDAEREKVLATLTKEERALLDDLNEKVRITFQVMAEIHSLESIVAYDNARVAYQKAAEKWPVLMDGYD
jgi:predicted Fe-S protein YdhL (DUF1289 family)